MPEDNLTLNELPEIPAQTIPQNEPVTTASDPSKNSLVEKVRRASSTVLAKAGITYRPGRGRPRKDGAPKISDIPLENPGASAPASPPPSVAVAAPADDTIHDALFARSVKSAVKGLLSFAKGLIKRKASEAGIDAGFTATALRECEPDAEVMADFSESLETVLQKYNVKTEYSPEIALAVSTARLAAPYWLLIQTFNAEIERKKRLENQQAETPPGK